MYLFLNQKGISSEKIWAFSPSVYAQNQPELISFTDQKNISPSGKIDWGYHVAPIVKVKIKNKIHQMVIDPALFPNRMVSYRTWLSKIRTKKLIYLIMEGQWYLFNSALITHAEFCLFCKNQNNILVYSIKKWKVFSSKESGVERKE